MKPNKGITIIGAGLLMLSMAACNDNYEKEPVEKFTLDYVFSTTDSVGNQARYFLNRMYQQLSNGHNRLGSDYLDAASDDAISIQYDKSDVYKLAMGQYTANSRIGGDMGWGDYYKVIRQANILIENIHRVPFNLTYTKANGEKAPLNVTMKAEARFLRAWNYFELVKRYGGVPLVGDKIFDVNDDLQLPRNTFAECIDYIVSELDAIKDDLRGLPTDDAGTYGHAPTIETCLALKARVLLYAASPLYNENPIEPGNELISYAQPDKNRWKAAADAAKYIIDTYGHKGSKVIGLTGNFRNVFYDFYSIGSNPEVIWFVQGSRSTSIEYNNGPLGFTGNAMGNGRTLPTQNLVESFPMLDGKPIGQSEKYAYNVNSQYDNRDPRLDYTIIHNGSRWLTKEIATYQGGANNPTSSALYTRTSYYMKKFMGSCESTSDYQSTLHLWVTLRYAEVLLNYAEALNEYLDAPTNDVYDCIVSLRARAGIEAGNNGLYGLEEGMTKEQMRDVIRNERRIEMAFEEHRYWDIRRWRIAEEVFASPLRGCQVLNSAGSISISEIDVLDVDFEPYRYYYPIPYSEVIKNSNMVQNPKW